MYDHFSVASREGHSERNAEPARKNDMREMTRRGFLESSCQGAAGLLGAAMLSGATEAPGKRPNILFAIADDWSWPHASAYGAPQVNTPHFDRVAREGILCNNAFTAAPQCSPNRAATLTGRYIWQIAEAGTHASIFPDTYPVYTALLEEAGYHTGFTRKGWSPGDWRRGGWKRNPAGKEYSARKLDEVPAKGMSNTDYAGNFEAFLDERPEDAPFCFWYGCSEPHRKYEFESGVEAGKDPEKVPMPEFLPDDPVVRKDMADYILEVEWFDTHLGRMLKKLEEIGELDNTLIVVTGDNGMPFPRAKANLYEYGTHVPLAVRWPERIEAGSRTDALISFIDFAPTFLEAAGVSAPETMTGHSQLPAWTGGGPVREQVLTGRERHTHARYDNLGYPARAIRTEDYLYIRNFKPERWPAGDPPNFHDIDGCPTKDLMMENEEYRELWEMAVGKRPADELFAVRQDPACMRNLAEDPAHAETLMKLRKHLMALLTEQGDPRAHGKGGIWESYPRVSHMRPYLGGFAERGKYNPKYAPSGGKQ